MARVRNSTKRRGRRARGTQNTQVAAKYDAAYSAKKDFVSSHNRFLEECLRRIEGQRSTAMAPRRLRALDVGVGQGRNALLLARRGYDTTGIDRSEVGVRDARRAAAARGLEIRIELADLRRYDFGRNRWDLIVLMYFPQPMILMPRLKSAVKPGGYILVERFSTTSECSSAIDVREMHRLNPMLRCFLDWHVLLYEHDVFRSDWHWAGESPAGPIVRTLARKPKRR